MADKLPVALQTGVSQRRVLLERVAGKVHVSALTQRLGHEQRVLDRLGAQLAPALTRSTQRKRDRLAALRLSAGPILRETSHTRDRLDTLARRLSEAGTRQLRQLGERLEAADRLRETLSYKATLARGYAVVRDGQGVVLTSRAAAGAASGLEIEFGDGAMKIGGAQGKPAAKGKPGSPEQGSLF